MYFFRCLCVIAGFSSTIVSAAKIHVLPSPRAGIADGPHWDVKTQSLYCADQIEANSTLLRYDYRENRVYSARIRNRNATSFIIPLKCKPNQFAIGNGRNIEIIHWDGYSEKAEVIRSVVNIEPEDLYATNSFNDAKEDPCGRFVGSTARALIYKDDPTVANASLVSYSKRNGLVRWRSDVYLSNGLTWNKKRRKFYYIDSCKLVILDYDWDPKSGAIYNPKIAFDFRINGIDPGFIGDGMNIDRDGLLWVGLYKGSSIVAIDPDRHEVVRRISFPIETVVAPVWGDPIWMNCLSLQHQLMVIFRLGTVPRFRSRHWQAVYSKCLASKVEDIHRKNYVVYNGHVTVCDSQILK